MLFTRCPECETTFRVTDEILKRAHGQVRCGRCASVFNAYAEQRDPNARSFDQPEPAAPNDSTLSSTAPPNGDTAPAAQTPKPPAVSQPTEPTPTASDAIAMTVGERSVTDVVAEVEQAAAATTDALDEREAPGSAAPPSGADAPISAMEVDTVLTAPAVVEAPSMGWPPFGTVTESGPARRSRAWGAAAALALLALGTQVVHHYRTDVAGDPTFGPWLQRAYEGLGVEVRPRWDVHQYEILDWVATAEPNARGLGRLKITAHILNRGPLRQPYPAVQLKLKDRWEEAVRSRLFGPTEYLPSDAPRGRLMSPGETTRAEIEVVDPGRDAYGFELDVCIEVEASLVSCGNDEVFL